MRWGEGETGKRESGRGGEGRRGRGVLNVSVVSPGPERRVSDSRTMAAGSIQKHSCCRCTSASVYSHQPARAHTHTQTQFIQLMYIQLPTAVCPGTRREPWVRVCGSAAMWMAVTQQLLLQSCGKWPI